MEGTEMNMKQWYSFYFKQITKSHQLGDQLEMSARSDL